jgi:hypothetical protein
MLRGLVVSVMVSVGGLEAAAGADCGKIPTRAGPVDYCVSITNSSKNPDILYYLHGAFPESATGAEKTFAGGDPGLIVRWKELLLAPPTVVSISWGPRWTLKEEKLEAFEHEIIPGIEARLPVARSRRRLILGASMGGLNAFIAWTHLPHLFDAAAFQCPAFSRLNPVSRRLQRIRHARKTGANLGSLDLISEIFAPSFKVPAEWTRYQPPQMMKTVVGQKLPPAYMVWNTRDEFGFNGAPEIRAAGHSIIYEPIDGSHCSGISSAGLALFLSDRPLAAVTATVDPSDRASRQSTAPAVQ